MPSRYLIGPACKTTGYRVLDGCLVSSTAKSPAATDSLRIPKPAVIDMAALTNRKFATGTQFRGSCWIFCGGGGTQRS